MTVLSMGRIHPCHPRAQTRGSAAWRRMLVSAHEHDGVGKGPTFLTIVPHTSSVIPHAPSVIPRLMRDPASCSEVVCSPLNAGAGFGMTTTELAMPTTENCGRHQAFTSDPR